MLQEFRTATKVALLGLSITDSGLCSEEKSLQSLPEIPTTIKLVVNQRADLPQDIVGLRGLNFSARVSAPENLNTRILAQAETPNITKPQLAENGENKSRNIWGLIRDSISLMGGLGFLYTLYRCVSVMDVANRKMENAGSPSAREEVARDAKPKERKWQRINLFAGGIYLAPYALPRLFQIPVEVPGWWLGGTLLLAAAQAIVAIPSLFPKRSKFE